MIEIRNITDVMKYLDGLKAAIFDLDDTLYSEKEYVRSGYKAVAAILPQVEDAEGKLWSAFEEKKNAIDEVLMAEGIYTDVVKQECLDTYRNHKPDIRLYDGVEEMVIQIHEMGMKIGIITDGRPGGQWAKIKVLGLEHHVDHIIVTDEMGGVEFRKPCENAFRLMKEKLDCEYSDMVYVGDNVSKDFIAPEKLGIRSIYYRNKNGIYALSLADSSQYEGKIDAGK